MSLKRDFASERSISPPPTKRSLVETNGQPEPESKLPSSDSNRTSMDFFTPASQKAPSPCRWRTVEGSLLICSHDGVDPHAATRPRKIAAFDLDSTLIATASGRAFGRDANDWRFWHTSVVTRLRQLVSDGYLVAIVSNQSGLSLGPASKAPEQDHAKVTVFKQKIVAVLKALKLPVSLYAATKQDLFRKPRTGMWEMLLADNGLKTKDIDLAASFFVGDAAGRPERRVKGKVVKKDFSCSDRDMAANVGIAFHTPEEYFLNKSPESFSREFDPAEYLATTGNGVGARVPKAFEKKNEVDIVLFVGSPGAGKSTYYWTQLQPLGYERVNQDILKTCEKCLSVASTHLKASISVCVDNTNPDIDVRARWIALAQQFNVRIRCVYFTSSTKLCEHNNTVRALGRAYVAPTAEDAVVFNPENRELLPRMAFLGYAKRLMEPELKEGFQDVAKVDFVFKGGDVARRVWSRYWVSA